MGGDVREFFLGQEAPEISFDILAVMIDVFVEAQMKDGFGIADDDVVGFDWGADEAGIWSGDLTQLVDGFFLDGSGVGFVFDNDTGAVLEENEGSSRLHVARAEFDEASIGAIVHQTLRFIRAFLLAVMGVEMGQPDC